jgi:chaperonin GroES
LIFQKPNLLLCAVERLQLRFFQKKQGLSRPETNQASLRLKRFFIISHSEKHTGGTHMKIRPLNDRILVKRLEGEAKTAGGIIIPDSAKEKPAEGEIVAVGPGKLNDAGERVAIDLAVGDRVLFSKYGGTEVKLDGEDFLIMREDDILGVVQA